MAQISFSQNFPHVPGTTRNISNATLLFFPHNISNSISLLTVNQAFQIVLSSSASLSLSVTNGLYSLSSSTLTLLNTISQSSSFGRTVTSGTSSYNFYISFTNTSATSNLIPGTWFWGNLVSSASSVNGVLNNFGGLSIDPINPFPNTFIGGRMTESTNALPASIDTSKLDITGSDALFTQYIIISG